jgi:hypothetical protein
LVIEEEGNGAVNEKVEVCAPMVVAIWIERGRGYEREEREREERLYVMTGTEERSGAVLSIKISKRVLASHA